MCSRSQARYQLTSSLSYNYIGERTNAPYGETITLGSKHEPAAGALPSYGLMNLRAGIKADDWSFNLFANNLSQQGERCSTRSRRSIFQDVRPLPAISSISHAPSVWILNYSFGRH